MKSTSIVRIIIFATCCSAFIFPSCSLKYDTMTQNEDFAPEFMFSNARYTTIEDAKETSILKADILERYKGGKSIYGKDISFELYDKEGKIESSGKCGLLSSNSDTEIYILYDDISIKNEKDNVTIEANILKWNGKNEQLTSNRNDLITIKKDNTLIQGTGFSASGISKIFSFTGVVSGTAETNEGQQNESKENDESKNKETVEMQSEGFQDDSKLFMNSDKNAEQGQQQ